MQRNLALGRFGSGTATLRTLTARANRHVPLTQTAGKSGGNNYDKADPLPTVPHLSSPPPEHQQQQRRVETIRATVIDQIGRANIKNQMPPKRYPSAVAGPSVGMRRGSPPPVSGPGRGNAGGYYYHRNPITTIRANPPGHTNKTGGGGTGGKPGNNSHNGRKGAISLNTIFPPHNASSMSGSVTDSQMFPYANMTAQPNKKNEFSTFNFTVENHIDPKALQSLTGNKKRPIPHQRTLPVKGTVSDGLTPTADKTEVGITDVPPPKFLEDLLDGAAAAAGIEKKELNKRSSLGLVRRPITAAGKLYNNNSQKSKTNVMSESPSPNKIRRLPPMLPFWAIGGASAEEAKKAELELKRPFSAPIQSSKYHITELDFLEALAKPAQYSFQLEGAQSDAIGTEDFAASNVTETALLQAALKDSLNPPPPAAPVVQPQHQQDNQAVSSSTSTKAECESTQQQEQSKEEESVGKSEENTEENEESVSITT